MTEREAVESLGEMDDIVESLMIDLIERTDKEPEIQPQSYPKSDFERQPTYTKAQPKYSKGDFERKPVFTKAQEPKQAKQPKPKAYVAQGSERSTSYDIFHDFDLVGKSGFKLNTALNRRFNCGYKYTIYAIMHYIIEIARIFGSVVMSIAACCVVASGVTVGIMYANSFGKILLVGGVTVFAAAIVMIIGIVGYKILGLVQSICDNIMRGAIDKRVLEVKYEIKY